MRIDRCLLTAALLLLLVLLAACSTVNEGVTPIPERDASGAFAVTALEGPGTYTAGLLVSEQEDAVAVTLGGDGSTSEGDFHEAINCAGVFDAKTVFVIQNNQWAISVPLHKQTAAETLAQKAHAYGVPGIQVDGNDIFAVYVAAHEAIERARSGGGPSLIEAVTYRLGDHTTADDATRYRADDELKMWEGRDPILRLRRYFEQKGLWDDDQEAVLLEEAQTWVEAQVKMLEDMPGQEPEAIFKFMYHEMPPHLVEQMAAMAEELRS